MVGKLERTQSNTQRILHECSCFIELIKRVKEKINCVGHRAMNLINSIIQEQEVRFCNLNYHEEDKGAKIRN